MNGTRCRLNCWADWLALLYCAALTLAVYWPVLGFSFILDDALDLTRTEPESFRALLGPQPNYVYYRPVPFILWKALRLLLGRYDPLVLHALPLAAHILAGWLFYLLLRRLTGSRWALLPATLFLVYPLSYQAVQDLGSLFHPLVTCELLAVALLWYDGRRLQSPLRLAAACLVAVLALWTHEYGVAVVPLLLALEALCWARRTIRRPSLWLLVPLAADALYVKLWFALDKPQGDYVSQADKLRNLGFWLEGVAYPVTAQAGGLARDLGLNPFHLVYATGLGALAAVLALSAWRGRPGWVLLALGVSLVAFLPAALELTHEYVQNSPRLLYVAAPGCAAFWGLLPLLRFDSRRATRLWRAATLVLAGLVIIQSVAFIHRRNVMEGYGSAEARGIIRLGATRPGGTLLLVNAPAWFAPWRQEYPIGHLGVQGEPSYVPLPTLVYTGSGVRLQGEGRSLDPDVAGWQYSFGPYGNGPITLEEIDSRLRAGAMLGVVDLLPDRLLVRTPGTLAPQQPPPSSRLAVFGGALWLTGERVERDGDLVTVTTRWYVARPLDRDVQLAVQLRDAGGRVVEEHSGYALDGYSAPRLWRAGDVVEDRVLIDLSGSRHGEPLSARLALVNAVGAAPLPVEAPPGVDTGDGWLPLGHH